MKVLVTGANGMLATNVIEVLLEGGYSVRGVLRRRGSYVGTTHSALELVEGDFTDQDTITCAIKGCGAVIHCAAITAQNLLHYHDYERVNVEATGRLAQLTAACSAKFVYVSSANTIGCGTRKNPGTELTPAARPLTDSLYGRSKAEAERLALQAGAIVVNPTFMIGKYGSSNGSNQVLGMARTITFCPSGGKSFVDVRDAARGVVAAMEHGRAGQRYLISGENLLFRDLFRLFPVVKCVVVVPACILMVAGYCGNVLRALGLKIALSVPNVHILCLEDAYDNQKARTELGYSPRPVAESVNSWVHLNL